MGCHSSEIHAFLNVAKPLEKDDAVAGAFAVWLHATWAAEPKAEGLQSWIQKVSEAVGVVHPGCRVQGDLTLPDKLWHFLK